MQGMARMTAQHEVDVAAAEAAIAAARCTHSKPTPAVTFNVDLQRRLIGAKSCRLQSVLEVQSAHK